MILLAFFYVANCFGQEDLFVGTWTNSFDVKKSDNVTYKFDIIVTIKKIIKSSTEIRIGEIDVIANKKCHKKWNLSWYYPDKTLNNIIFIDIKRPDTTECDKKNMATNEYSHEAYMQIINANYFDGFEEIFGSTGKEMYLILSDSNINEVLLMGRDEKYYGSFHRKNKINDNRQNKENSLFGWWIVESSLPTSTGNYPIWGCVGLFPNGKGEVSKVGKGIYGCTPAMKNINFTWSVSGNTYIWKGLDGSSGSHPITWITNNKFSIPHLTINNVTETFTRSNSEYDAKSWYNSLCQAACPDAQIRNNGEVVVIPQNEVKEPNNSQVCINCQGTCKSSCSVCSGSGSTLIFKEESKIVTEYDPVSGHTYSKEVRENMPSNGTCYRCKGVGRDPYVSCPACKCRN